MKHAIAPALPERPSAPSGPPDSTSRALLRPTRLLDFDHPALRALVEGHGWRGLPTFERIGAAYDYVRDGVAFGYNASDDVPASAVLADGYGQCNTKGTLLMALLRALGVPCRLHGFTITKALQRGVVPELVYQIAPESILHSWVEVWYDGRWVNLEGFILDRPFLAGLQNAFGAGPLCAYGAGTDDLCAPGVEWEGADTYVQRTGINADLGVFDTPDAFYAEHRQDFPRPKEWLYRYVIRHWMNRRTQAIRRGRVPRVPGSPRARREPQGDL